MPHWSRCDQSRTAGNQGPHRIRPSLVRVSATQRSAMAKGRRFDAPPINAPRIQPLFMPRRDWTIARTHS